MHGFEWSIVLGNVTRSTLEACGLHIRSLVRQVTRFSRDRRGTVALSFAVAVLPIATAVAVAVDFSSLAAGRAALQRAADNAALSGAAAYVGYTTNDTLRAVAVTTASSAFCNATTALPGGFTVTASSGSQSCGTAQGAAVAATIAGYNTGTPGLASNAGCSATQTVVSGYKCGFAVTVTATALTNTTLASLVGASHTLSVTATAVNPFVNLGTALTASMSGGAYNANSIWVYPLVLNADGQPDLSANGGALPDTSACTGNPDQGWCGSYSMLASTRYAQNCTNVKPCTVSDGTQFGDNGVVLNVHASSAVVTATTPLGVAFQSAIGAGLTVQKNVWGTQDSQYSTGCTYPNKVLFNAVTQIYDSLSQPIYVNTHKDSQGNTIKDSNNKAVQYWDLPTTWFYSSYLLNNMSPTQPVIDAQSSAQAVKPFTKIAGVISQLDPCPDGKGKNVPPDYRTTTYPATGNTNCALIIVKDATSTTPPSSLTNTCYTPSATVGREYAALSCQNYGVSRYTFFWNDMGGGCDTKNDPNCVNGDDKNYANGTLVLNCSAVQKIVLIN